MGTEYEVQKYIHVYLASYPGLPPRLIALLLRLVPPVYFAVMVIRLISVAVRLSLGGRAWLGYEAMYLVFFIENCTNI